MDEAEVKIEETPQEPPKKKSGRPKGSPNKSKIVKAEDKSNRKLITVDNTIEEVLSYNKEGYLLSFEDEPGKFLVLESKVLAALTDRNRTSYMLSEGFHARRVREARDPESFATPGLKVNPRLATATDRLRVEGGDPNKHYCWKRPDELQQAAYDGYQIARGENLKTFMGKGDVTHKVGAMGQDELVLMEVPKELHEARMKANESKSQSRIAAVEKNAIEEMRQGGGRGYVPQEEQEWS